MIFEKNEEILIFLVSLHFELLLLDTAEILKYYAWLSWPTTTTIKFISECF